jgi:hypothetical protein
VTPSPLDGLGLVSDRRARARELRFLVDQALATEILTWARQQLVPDPHGIGSHRDAYKVTTLYFDTPAYDVFNRNGSYRRAKYRIRRYDVTGVAFFERKLRTRRMLAKRRSPASLANLEQLWGPSSNGPVGGWFRRRLQVRRLGPVCQIAYDRSARQITSGQSVARLTVDTNIRAWPIETPQFVDGKGVSLLDGRAVVELKFQAVPPPAFKALVERFGLQPEVFSKYRLAMSRLGLVPRGQGERQDAGMTDVTEPV